MRWLKRLLWLLLALVLLVAIGLPLAALGLLGSEGGTRWLLDRTAEMAQVDGFSLHFDSVTGTLLHELRLQGVRVQAAGSQVDAETLTLRWKPTALRDRTLHIQALQAAGLRVQPPPPSAEPPQPLSLPELALPLTVQLDRLQIDGLSVAQAPGEDLSFETIALTARLDDASWTLRELLLRGAGLDLSGEATLAPRAPHELEAHIAGSVEAPEVGQTKADVRLSGPALQPQFRLAVSAPAALQATGQLDLGGTTPRFDITADWAALDWPLRGPEPPQVETRHGRLQLQGSADDYQLQLSAEVSGPDIPATAIDLEGQGDARGLRVAPLTLHTLSGTLAATGAVHWDPRVSWDLALTAEGLDPGLQFPDWPGRLSGQLQTSGQVDAAGPRLQASIAVLEGQLRDQPVRASGGIRYRAGELHAEALDLASGPNRLQLNGRADAQFDLAFELDAPDLAAAYPGLVGRAQGQGRLTGTPAAPVVTAKLDGRDLGYDTLRIGEVQLQADWTEDGGRAVLHAEGLGSGELVVDRVAGELTGTPTAHALSLEAAAPDLRLDLAARGGLAEGSWRGELQRLALTEPVLGSWQLRAPAQLQLGAERLHSSQLCLDQQQASTRLCLAGGWAQATGLAAEGELRDLDLAQFAALLPGEVALSGRLAGDLQVSGALDNPRAQVQLRPGDGRLSLATDDEPLELTYRDAELSASFADDRGSAELRLQLGDGGRAEGRVTLGPGPQRALGGRISALFPNLELVEGFVPDLTEVKGRLQLEMTLAGTVDAPRAAGQLQVQEASANLPLAGLELRDIALAVSGDGLGPLAVRGGVSSGDGRLQVNGQLDPAASGGPAIDLKVTGEAFQVARLPEAVVEIAPRLRLAGQGPYRLDGTLRIPKARIELEELPSSSVSVSDDEVVVGEEPPPGRGGPRGLTAAVRVELGEEVSFKGFGVTTGLTGALDAAVDDQGSRLHGKIELRDAAYKAYGQDLKVEQGRLLFAGPPDNPELDLRAVRESRDGRVKAYLDVRGPAAKPRLRVYSEPTLPEPEALAYLLTGRGLDQAGQQEGVNIASAALSLGLAKGEPLLQDLGNRLGLDELRYEGGTDPSEGGSLVLGKYLNPSLYLGYSQGLFNPEGAVLLRLKLSERLDLESRAGTEQAIDLFYRYEHD